MPASAFDRRVWLPRLWKNPFSGPGWRAAVAAAALCALLTYLAHLTGPLAPRVALLRAGALSAGGTAGGILWSAASIAALAAWTIFAASFSLWIADKTAVMPQNSVRAGALVFGWAAYPALWLKSLFARSRAGHAGGAYALAAASAAFFAAFAAPEPALEYSGESTPLLWLLCAGTVFSTLVFYAGWSSCAVSSRLGALRSARQFAACESARFIAAACAIACAGGASVSAAAQGQAGFWFGALPRWFAFFPVAGQLAFFVYAAASLALCQYGAFAHPAGNEIYGGWAAAGRPVHFALAQFARGANLFICAFLGAALFLGGPGTAAGYAPGWFVLLAKTFLLVALLGLGASAFSPAGPAVAERFGWKIMLPLALLAFAVTGVWLWLA